MNDENNKLNHLTSIITHEDVTCCIDLALKEDRVDRDITTMASDLSKRKAVATIISKSTGILSGSALISQILLEANKKFQIGLIDYELHVTDGSSIKPKDKLITLKGNASDLLRVERTILNFMIRMTGIATTTNNVVTAVQSTPCKVLHTRKTAPGLRRPDVYAALCGGASPHRLNLADAILVKENHLRGAPSLQHVFDGIQKYRNEAKFLEIEVTNLLELKHAIAAKPTRIMLDNFTPDNCIKAVNLFGGMAEFEASGGINTDNALTYAETGVDYISMGWITHSAPAADLSMLFEVQA
jgi:nicotinate-nucleotide pyrophosphorylase (carboxylating)